MKTDDIIRQLTSLGSDSYKRILLNHGAREPVLGVKIEALKKIVKPVKKDYGLAKELYATGIYDAQYLAGLMADEKLMTEPDLQQWLTTANCVAIGGTVVAWVAAESRHGHDVAVRWIESPREDVAQAGWATYSSLVAVVDDSKLDLSEIRSHVQRIGKTIHQQPNHVRYAMNGFVIAVGSYVRELTEQAIATGIAIGPVSVDMGETACQVPYAPDYIEKVKKRGTVGKKRRRARC